MKKASVDIVIFIMILFILNISVVPALDLNTEITAEEKAQFDEILIPVIKIYNLVKYTVSFIAVMALLFAGVSYMFSGNDIKKRDTSKNMVAYVIIGLAIIWAAPYIVNLLIE